MKENHIAWTPALVAILTSMWEEGQLPGVIAEAIGHPGRGGAVASKAYALSLRRPPNMVRPAPPRPANQEIDWNDEQVETLKRLWHDGIEVKAIAAAIGHPGKRSAVIAKAKRLELPQHPNAGLFSDNQRTIEARSNFHPSFKVQNVAAARAGVQKFVDPEGTKYLGSKEWTPPEGWEPVIGPGNASDHTCRWPYGDPKEPGFGYCGEMTKVLVPAVNGKREQRSVWCPHHHGIAVLPEDERRAGMKELVRLFKKTQ